MRQRPGFDEASVLALVNQLHAVDPRKRTFTLMEIAEAMTPGQANFSPGTVVISTYNKINQPPMPAWMETLNNILEKLGQDGELTIMPMAVVVFPPGHN